MDMDLGMDIASYSMANAANNLMQSVGVSIAFKNFRLAGNAGRRIGENDGNVSEPKCWCKH